MTPSKPPMSDEELYEAASKAVSFGKTNFASNSWLVDKIIYLAKRYSEAQKAQPVTDEKLREAASYFAGLAAPFTSAIAKWALIDAALAELAELRANRQWRPIETAPRDGSKVLLAKFGYWNDTGDAQVGSEVWQRRIWDNTRRTYGLWWCVAGHWSEQWNNWNDGVEPSGLAGPTHWMPLPTPPKEA